MNAERGNEVLTMATRDEKRPEPDTHPVRSNVVRQLYHELRVSIIKEAEEASRELRRLFDRMRGGFVGRIRRIQEVLRPVIRR
jgi:hypothetical protein